MGFLCDLFFLNLKLELEFCHLGKETVEGMFSMFKKINYIILLRHNAFKTPKGTSRGFFNFLIYFSVHKSEH